MALIDDETIRRRIEWSPKIDMARHAIRIIGRMTLLSAYVIGVKDYDLLYLKQPLSVASDLSRVYNIGWVVCRRQ